NGKVAPAPEISTARAALANPAAATRASRVVPNDRNRPTFSSLGWELGTGESSCRPVLPITPKLHSTHVTVGRSFCDNEPLRPVDNAVKKGRRLGPRPDAQEFAALRVWRCARPCRGPRP